MKHISYIKGRSRGTAITLLCSLSALGIAAGAVFQTMRSPQPTALVHQFFAPIYTGSDLFGYMSKGFGMTAALLGLAFFMGFFAVGHPVGCFIMLFRGFGIGASGAVMYSLYGGKAVFGMLVFVLPKAILLIFVCALGVREALRASSYTLSGWLPEGFDDHEKTDLRLYCIKFIVLIIISLMISAADAAVNFVFAG